jgi:hypothetical protein
MENLENGYRYRDPAPQTLKFMEQQVKFNQDIKLDVNDMKNDIKAIGSKLDEHINQQAKDFSEVKGILKEFCDSCDGKYASKDFQTIATRIAGAIGLIILGALATAIFKLIFK